MDEEITDRNLGSCLTEFIDDGSIESYRYFLARRTVLEMLKDRGYAVPNSDIEVSIQEFRAKHGQVPNIDDLKVSALHKDNPDIKIQVLFCSPSIVKVNAIRAISAMIVNKDTLSRLILIVQSKMTSQALKALESFPFKVEIFQITDVLVNITRHELKPKHQVLSNQEKADLLEKYSINEKQILDENRDLCLVPRVIISLMFQFLHFVVAVNFIEEANEGLLARAHSFSNVLPKMSEKDAIARYYGLEKGQVVKITYSGELTQLHVTYRCIW